MEIPRNIVAGDSVQWVDSLLDYPSPEWALKYVLVSPLTKIEIESVPDVESDGHLFSFTSATTTAWQPGNYSYQGYATSGTERKTVGRGLLSIEIDYSAQEKHDARPWLDRAIAAVEGSLAGRASSSQLVMDIDGSRIEHISHLDQLELLARLYKRRSARARARLMSAGANPFATVRVEF